MPRPTTLALLTALTLVTTAAAAQGPAEPIPAALSRYLANPAYRAAVIASARQANERLPGSCGTVELRPTGLVSIERPVRFDAFDRPVDGMWAEPVTATGCGMTRRYNVLTIAAPDREPHQVGLLPGTTRAAAMLQHDAIAYAFLGTALLAKGCKQLAVTDTRYDDVEGGAAPIAKPEARLRPWRETWTVWACGTLIDVPVHFIPGAAGTTISVRPEEAKPRR